MTLLSKGLPYDALTQASEDRVYRWYAMMSEESEIETERVDRMILSG